MRSDVAKKSGAGWMEVLVGRQGGGRGLAVPRRTNFRVGETPRMFDDISTLPNASAVSLRST